MPRPPIVPSSSDQTDVFKRIEGGGGEGGLGAAATSLAWKEPIISGKCHGVSDGNDFLWICFPVGLGLGRKDSRRC